jgi:hypothetical protein
MRVSMTWRDGSRRLSLRLVPQSRVLPPLSRPIDVRVAGSTKTTRLTFTGKPVSVTIA